MAKNTGQRQKPKDVARRLSEPLDLSDRAFTAELMEIVREQGITTMARKAGVSRHSLYRYEWGTDRPLFETVIKMAAACGVKLTVVPTQGSKGNSSS